MRAVASSNEKVGTDHRYFRGDNEVGATESIIPPLFGQGTDRKLPSGDGKCTRRSWLVGFLRRGSLNTMYGRVLHLAHHNTRIFILPFSRVLESRTAGLS